MTGETLGMVSNLRLVKKIFYSSLSCLPFGTKMYSVWMIRASPQQCYTRYHIGATNEHQGSAALSGVSREMKSNFPCMQDPVLIWILMWLVLKYGKLHAAARLPNCQPHIYIRHMIVCIQLHVCIQLSGYVHMVSLISGLECGMEWCNQNWWMYIVAANLCNWHCVI